MPTLSQQTETLWGTVAENSIFGKEEVILVFLNEAFPNSGGKLEVNPEVFTVKGKDASGKHYTLKTKTDSVINATYLPRQTNRVTAPQMKKGERVLVHRFSNDGNYYWEPLNMDNNRKVQETVVFSYAAKKNSEDGEDSTPKNCYSQTFDGTNGYIEQRMTEANGEKSPWLVQYNAKTGFYTLTDQKGNVVQIDTNSTTIDIINADKSHIQLTGKTINIFTHDIINITSTNEINMETKTLNIKCETYNHKADNVKWEIGSAVNMSIGSQMTVDCPTINLNGIVNVGSLNVTGTGAPSSDAAVKGNIKVDGQQQISGDTSVGGSVSIGGSLSASGPVSFPSGGSIAGYD